MMTNATLPVAPRTKKLSVFNCVMIPPRAVMGELHMHVIPAVAVTVACLHDGPAQSVRGLRRYSRGRNICGEKSLNT